MYDIKIRILLIEHDIGDIQLIQELLKNAKNFNYDLTLAATISEAFEYVRKSSFDIVLIDLLLPDSDGFDTVIRTREKIKNSPIIVLSSLKDELIARKAVQVGVQDYLIKDLAISIFVKVFHNCDISLKTSKVSFASFSSNFCIANPACTIT